ncbi:Alpha-N-acetylglucosaminidase [Hondaea fermentalgiana]|uniref:Alpha-N-acetylglucosaminidase n=1 Tax=Hondaea fermentalgiana TaxID=2315210 RepID=A0A2R5G8R0_9STRA|nr:Alpha-N-acetylglucosaminidase [Hondaea fermentalgiana]|eukprot:GBG24441.1 Alpha-N-acetylglucosaminidase [Hondaea fermentalgiana]
MFPQRLGCLTTLVLVAFTEATSQPTPVDYEFRGKGSPNAITDTLSRVLDVEPEWIASRFSIEMSSSPDEKEKYGFYEICDGTSGTYLEDKIVLRGASGPDLGYAASTYLRQVYNMSFSWNRTGGHQTANLQRDIPGPLSRVGGCIRGRRATQISYLNNVVTFSYSYAWFLFADWSYLLDWMVLSGINLSIAYTGQEEVFRKVFNRFGVSNQEYASWTNGIAYLAWSRGQRLHGCAGGLDLKTMRQQWDLQRKILARMRALGIVAVLPTFQGNVPTSMRQRFPNASMSADGIAWVDGTDPLFREIQAVYMDTLLEDFGTDHWYETDGYFNFAPEPWLRQAPWSQDRSASGEDFNSKCRYNVASASMPSPITVRKLASGFSEKDGYDHASSVYQSMADKDPEAVWLYQGWIWRGWDKDRLPYMRGFESGSPLGRFVVLDMFDEINAEWDKFDYFAYFRHPFIWGTLHNFGGNLGLWGNMNLLESAPRQAYNKTESSLAGIGAAPEGIDHNPAYYALLFDMPWRLADAGTDTTPASRVQQFLDFFVRQRYGVESELAREAWALLHKSVYGQDNEPLIAAREWLAEKSSDGVTALANGGYMNTPYKIWYSLEDVRRAWALLTDFADQRLSLGPSKVPRTLTYDLVNAGREVLAKTSGPWFERMVNTSLTTDERKRAGVALLRIQRDMDRLLCTESSFTLQEVLDKAADLARSIDANDYTLRANFLVQARSQSTTWGPQTKRASKPDSTNLDYANKHWAGQLDGFYTMRTECYLAHLESLPAFHKCVAMGSYKWTHDVQGATSMACQPDSSRERASAIQVSKTLLQIYKA